MKYAIEYYSRLIVWAAFFLLSLVGTPVVSLFREIRYGQLNNASSSGFGWRLKPMFHLFDTPDNALPETWWGTVKWLYRNPLYGLNTEWLSEYVTPQEITAKGDPRINKNNGIEGMFLAHCNSGVFQFKYAKRLIGRYGVMLNFGWELDTVVKTDKPALAMFMFSPRLVTFDREK